jgi:repressor LexA
MDTIDRILYLLQREKKTRNVLSVDTGISSGLISDWVARKKSPSSNNIKKLAAYFNVSADYLLGLRDSEGGWLENNGAPAGGFGQVAVYGKVSAGNGALAANDIIGYEPAEEKFANENYFFLEVSGDSMSPKIDNGDIVLVKKQSSIDSGAVAVCLVDDEEGVVKKVVYSNNYIELHSFNPLYPVRRFDGADVLRIRVVGRVIESKKKW